MGAAEIEAFLTDLAVRGKVSASTKNQALSALLSLYQSVLEHEIDGVNAIRAKAPMRLPSMCSGWHSHAGAWEREKVS